MGARVVERARLESVCALNGTEGSNPSPSASLLPLKNQGFEASASWSSRVNLSERKAQSYMQSALGFITASAWIITIVDAKRSYRQLIANAGTDRVTKA